MDDAELGALEQQVQRGLRRYQDWVRRAVDILFAVGYQPTARLYGMPNYEWVQELTDRQPSWQLLDRGHWDRFLVDATLRDYYEVIPHLRAQWLAAERQGLVPELPVLMEPLVEPDHAPPPPVEDAPTLAPPLAKVAAQIKAADDNLRNAGYRSYFLADLARECGDKPDTFRHLVKRYPALLEGLPIRDRGKRGGQRVRIPKNVPKDIPKDVPNIPNPKTRG